MALCASCSAPAVVLYDARGGADALRLRAALACEQHRRAVRRWVAAVGPAVTETSLTSENTAHAPATLF